MDRAGGLGAKKGVAREKNAGVTRSGARTLGHRMDASRERLKSPALYQLS